MPKYAAFLRAINVGGRRVANDELRRIVTAAGCGEVSAYQAAGNLVLDWPDADATRLTQVIEQALETSLGYEVETFLRTGDDMLLIAAAAPFGSEEIAAAVSKPQVVLLRTPPVPDAVRAVSALSTGDDRLVVSGAELYWLPKLGVGRSMLDMGKLGGVVGPMTVRTAGTISRIAKKFF